MNNTINYVGWVTPNNLGDEALYSIDQAIFAKYNLNLRRITNTLRQKHSQTTIIGGGTCLPLITLYMRPTKYSYVFGAGVEDPVFYGPFDPVLIARLKQFNFRLIGVRGNISRALLKDWGIDSEVIGDPCLSLTTSKIEAKHDNRIAVNVGAASPAFSWKSGDTVFKELSKVCRKLKDKGYELVLIPFWTNNMHDIERLSKSEGIPIFKDWSDIEANINLISTCKALIGEKLHSLVFSAAVNTPFVGLAYAPEHFDFADSVGFSNFVMPTTETTADKILTLFDDIINNYEKTQNKLAIWVNEYRERQKKFAARINADIANLPEDKWAVQNNFGNTLIWGTDVFLERRLHVVWKIWSNLFYSRMVRCMNSLPAWREREPVTSA